MKKTMLLLVTIASVLIVVPGCFRREIEVRLPCGEELVKNGSFEDGTFSDGNPTQLTDLNNCTTGSDRCLLNWQVSPSARGNPVQWFQTPTPVGGIPPDPDPNERRFLDLSGATHKGPFPTVHQTIQHLDAGNYQLQFDLGQGNAPPSFSGPVALQITLVSEARGFETISTIQTDASGRLWQTRTIPLWIPRSTDLQLFFQARADQTKSFVGLDNVSLRQLKPVGDCLRP